MKAKILIADDDESILMLYSLMLEREYKVIKAENGAEAVELYKEHGPELTLMDIDMPVLPGDEAITRIFNFDPEARVIAVTGGNYSADELGVKVLRKGFRMKEFLKIIKNCVEGGEWNGGSILNNPIKFMGA
jgi:CheY-like chemotaxis protein